MFLLAFSKHYDRIHHHPPTPVYQNNMTGGQIQLKIEDYPWQINYIGKDLTLLTQEGYVYDRHGDKNLRQG